MITSLGNYVLYAKWNVFIIENVQTSHYITDIYLNCYITCTALSRKGFVNCLNDVTSIKTGGKLLIYKHIYHDIVENVKT